MQNDPARRRSEPPRSDLFFVRILRQAGGLSRKAPSNARGDDPFLGGFFFIFFLPRHGGRSPQAAPGLGFSLDFSGGKPTFLLCGNLLSLDRGNGFAQAFIFPGWFVPSGSRSDRAGPGLGRGSGDGNPATLSEGGIQPQHISKPGSNDRTMPRRSNGAGVCLVKEDSTKDFLGAQPLTRSWTYRQARAASPEPASLSWAGHPNAECGRQRTAENLLGGNIIE